MAQTPEGKVKAKTKRILDKFKATGDLWYHFVANNGYGRSGCPDILACCHGTFIAIELKADNTKRPTTLQQRQLDAISRAGGISLVINKDNIDVLEPVIGVLCEEARTPSNQYGIQVSRESNR